MDEDSKREDLTFRIKQLLQNNGIKLWLPPYYRGKTSDIKLNDEIVELAEQYRKIVNADFQLCAEILLELQDKSLKRLQDQRKFQAEGLATITAKISSQKIPEFSVQLRLSDNSEILRQSIAEKINISAERLKLIANGKILKFDQILEQQGVKHGNTVLVIILPAVSPGASVSNSVDNVDEKLVQETIKDVEFLTQKAMGKNVLSVTDQSGHFLNIPETSRQHLLSAMTLHEKGRSAFKRGSYSLALVFYLEADNESKMTSYDLLDKVDNYGLLNLDIVWCYLHLNSVHYLSDAEKRLQICDETFRRCYGPNLERVRALKGTCGNESVLLVRLHLLQAILHHLLNRNEIAKQKFNQVDSELNNLRVDDEKIATLVSQLGCTTKEARLGLRASFNDPDGAYDFIMRQREMRKRRRAVEKIKSITNHCICEDGTPVDPEKVHQLIEMGYSQLLTINGLKNSNNDVDNAIIWISNYVDNLKNLYPSFVADVISSIDISSRIYLAIYRYHKYELNETCIAQLIAASTSIQQAMQVFPNTNLGIENLSLGPSTSSLVSFLETATNTSVSASGTLSTPSAVPPSPSLSSSSLSTNVAGILPEALSAHNPDELSNEEYLAYERLSRDINDTTDDYLDNTLENEEKFFNMYKSLLK